MRSVLTEPFIPTIRTPSFEACADRFRAKIDKRSPDECWPWLAYCNSEGYGIVRFGEHVYKAHRVAYELAIGLIPDGLTIDHLCRNRSCCNPVHLEPVTMGVNGLRGDGPAARHARKTHCPAGHPYDEQNTLVSGGSRYCRTCVYEGQRRRRREARAA